ncbi:MAG: DegT/DnrJ/EryC1/StrS family aminotransferase [Vicinamibacterales bacterium]
MLRQTNALAIRGGEPVIRRQLDFDKGVSFIGEAEKRAVAEVLDSRLLLRHHGTKVSTFEGAFAEHLGARFVLACSSGTTALRLGLTALHVGPGDEVVVPAITFIACVGAVVAQGARPVFCDVDEHLTLDAAALVTRLTSRTRAVMPVHLYGTACDIDAIRAVCRPAGVAVLEDTAQACGARVEGRCLGTFGEAGAFSFQQGKMMTSGEGGALATNDEETYHRAVRYHDHGNDFPLLQGEQRAPAGGAAFLGENFRMSEMAGAMLLCQLERLDGLIENTRRVRGAIEAGISDLPLELVGGPRTRDATGIALRFPTKERALRYMAAFRAEGVPCGRLYDGKPVYAVEQVMRRLTATRSCAFQCPAWPAPEAPLYSPGMCARGEDLVARTVGIAVGPAYTDTDIEDVVLAIRKVTEVLTA